MNKSHSNSSYSSSISNNLPNSQRGGIFSYIFLLLLIAGMVLFTFYMMELDRTIVNKFEGKRWNIPAKVYSRPLELYEGAEINTEKVDEWLKLLNYRQNSQYNVTGSYHKDKSTYYIHTRGFDYSSFDKESEQVIKLTISGGQVKDIQSTEPSETGIVRIEPITIGGIYPDNNEDRVVVNINEVPKTLIDALIATEDRGYYEHYGVSIRGIGRAVVNNFSGKSMQGGSTLTQQLIKNFYLNSERSLKRKANEALMALLLEAHYDKNTILQTYLNEINLGQSGNRSINGFGLAAEFYFNTPLNELSVDQQALLVGMAKGPSLYNPRRNPENALNRRNTVLNNMLVTGKLSQTDYDEAIEKPLGVVEKPLVGKSLFPDFLDVVKRELNEMYYADDLKNEGLQIITTMDPMVQNAADDAMDKKLAQLRRMGTKTKNLEGALISANPKTGELVAVVGSAGEFTGFNRAIDAKRQVGSLLKPVIYLNALDTGKYNLASGIDDSPITINLSNGQTWEPKNYGGVNHGNVSLNTALAKSYNQAAVRVGMEFGLNKFIKRIKNMGVEEKVPSYPSSFLGSAAMSPADMLSLYQVFATGGFRTPIHSIRSVVDDEGRLLQRSSLKTIQSIDPKTNYLIDYALQQVVSEGTAKKAERLGKDLNIAGKTGTTNDYKDAWFAGYSGNYVSVVWVGRDDNKSIGLSGSDGALPVWIDYMKRLDLTANNQKQPEGIEWLWLEDGEGTLSNEECLEARYIPVMSKYIPKEASECAIALYEAKKAAEAQRLIAQQLELLQQRQLGVDNQNSDNIKQLDKEDNHINNQSNGNQPANEGVQNNASSDTETSDITNSNQSDNSDEIENTENEANKRPKFIKEQDNWYENAVDWF